MIELNLPPPSTELMDAIKYYAPIKEPNPLAVQSVPLFKKLNPELENIAIGIYFGNPVITEIAEREFNHFFPGENFNYSCSVIKNTNPGVPTCLPPHSDKGRLCGLHFVVDSGGPNVRTVFYDQYRPYTIEDNSTPPRYLPYRELKIKDIYAINDPKWTCIDTVQYHSVEHIDHDRILFAISFFELSMFDIKEKYSHLVVN